MDQRHIIWVSYHKPEILARGYWDQAILEHTFSKVGGFEHHQDFEWVNDEPEEYYDRQGAVVVINGRTHIEDTEQLNKDIAKLRWCLLIVTGDEEALFPWREVKHPRMAVWYQLARMNQHDDVSYHLPNGYRPETRDLLASIGEQPRTLDFFFAGQITHDRRNEMFEHASKLNDIEGIEGLIYETKSFGEEAIPYKEYVKNMASAKIAFCPSGPESPDSFRLYEALEAGCLPIVDAFSTKHKHPGFWRYLFGDDIPFPIVEYWDVLPDLVPELLKGWPANANKVFAWWQQKRREIRFKLEDDMKELSK